VGELLDDSESLHPIDETLRKKAEALTIDRKQASTGKLCRARAADQFQHDGVQIPAPAANPLGSNAMSADVRKK
jgi:hypothetical protein